MGRTAYDCAPKRYRAEFLCALNRATLAEAVRHSDCIRGDWQGIMMQFPELGLLRELREMIKLKVFAKDAEEKKEDKSSKWDDDKPQVSAWANTWRERIRAVLPRGVEGATPLADPEARQLMANLWKDVATWARTQENGERALQLFSGDGSDEWAFVPVGDLYLIVTEGIVGMTAEGLMA